MEITKIGVYLPVSKETLADSGHVHEAIEDYLILMPQYAPLARKAYPRSQSHRTVFLRGAIARKRGRANTYRAASFRTAWERGYEAV